MCNDDGHGCCARRAVNSALTSTVNAVVPRRGRGYYFNRHCLQRQPIVSGNNRRVIFEKLCLADKFTCATLYMRDVGDESIKTRCRDYYSKPITPGFFLYILFLRVRMTEQSNATVFIPLVIGFTFQSISIVKTALLSKYLLNVSRYAARNRVQSSTPWPKETSARSLTLLNFVGSYNQPADKGLASRLAKNLDHLFLAQA